MARESKAALAQRIERDNRQAKVLRTGNVAQDEYFGKMVLGRRTGDQAEGWDIYEVKHSGFTHHWSSASVNAAFGKRGK